MDQAELERLKMDVSQFLAQSFLELDEGERQLMKRLGLTLTQFWALVHLKSDEGRSLSELADLLICDKSNVTKIVDVFEARGLAERKPGKAGDRRYTRVVLTPQGQQLRKELVSAQEHLLGLRFQTLREEGLQELYRNLKQLAGTLQLQFKNEELPEMIESAIEHMRAMHGTSAASLEKLNYSESPFRRAPSRARLR